MTHQLARNEGGHHLHGGPAGLDRFVWDAEAGRDGESLAVRLRLSRPAGDQGYPGALSAEVTYRASADARLSLEYRATTTASTIIGLTSHAYFTLGSPSWAAELRDPRSGRAMRLVTDQPGLGVYTGERLSPPLAGICLQASAWPDAPNRPDFPSCRLDPGQVYRQLTTCAFSCGG